MGRARIEEAVVLSEEARRFLRSARVPLVFQIVLARPLAKRMRRHREVNWSEVIRIGFRRAVGMPVPERMKDVSWRKSRGVGFAGKGSIGVVLDELLAAKMALVHGMDWRGYAEFVLDKFLMGLEQGLAETAVAETDAKRRKLRDNTVHDLAQSARRLNRGLPKRRRQQATTTATTRPREPRRVRRVAVATTGPPGADDPPPSPARPARAGGGA